MLSTRRRANGAGCAGVAGEHALGRQPLHLYGYLWAKPDFLVDDDSGSFSFVLPDTVLFKHQKPVKWFFTSKQERGKILTKSKKNVSVAHVLQSFTENQHPPPPTAVDEEQSIVATYTYPDRTAGGELVMVVEHLTRDGVNHLLMNRDKPSMSVLQRFVSTRSGYNHMIQSVFTPDSFLVRKCVNPHVVREIGLSVAERTATFEADERLVQPRDVTNRELCEKIEHTHLEMSNHLQKLIGKPIARIVSYFKHGADNRVYFLWSTMLSFESGNMAFAKNLRLALSHNDRLQLLVATASASATRRSTELSSMPAKYMHFGICPACRTRISHGMICFYVTFKAVIKAFECLPEDPLSGNLPRVPPLLESILSPISDERYGQLRRDKAFMYRTVKVCRECAGKINSAKKSEPKSRIDHIRESSYARDTERQLPIYMQSAHCIFWGKVKREEAARSRRTGTPSSHEHTERVGISRPRPSASIQTMQKHLHGLTKASLRRLLPQLTAKSSDTPLVEPRHCMEKLAEHLQCNFGGPSLRLALARTNIFPVSSTVSVDTLEWVCEPKLLAEVFAYWSEVSKATGHGSGTSAMDLDLLDTMLSAYVEGNVDGVTKADQRQQPQLSLDETQPFFDNTERSTSLHSTPSLIHPVRPASNRPRSSIIHRPSPNRHSRVVGANNRTSAKRDGDIAKLQLHQPGTFTVQSSTPKRFRRHLDGVLCEVEINVLQDYNNSLSLAVKAWPQKGVSSDTPDDGMQVTLTASQILALVQPRDTDASFIPCSAEALIEAVLNALSIRHGSLVVGRVDPTLTPESTLAVELSVGSELTDEERSVLENALGR